MLSKFISTPLITREEALHRFSKDILAPCNQENALDQVKSYQDLLPPVNDYVYLHPSTALNAPLPYVPISFAVHIAITPNNLMSETDVCNAIEMVQFLCDTQGGDLTLELPVLKHKIKGNRRLYTLSDERHSLLGDKADHALSYNEFKSRESLLSGSKTQDQERQTLNLIRRLYTPEIFQKAIRHSRFLLIRDLYTLSEMAIDNNPLTDTVNPFGMVSGMSSLHASFLSLKEVTQQVTDAAATVKQISSKPVESFSIFDVFRWTLEQSGYKEPSQEKRLADASKRLSQLQQQQHAAQHIFRLLIGKALSPEFIHQKNRNFIAFLLQAPPSLARQETTDILVTHTYLDSLHSETKHPLHIDFESPVTTDDNSSGTESERNSLDNQSPQPSDRDIALLQLLDAFLRKDNVSFAPLYTRNLSQINDPFKENLRLLSEAYNDPAMSYFLAEKRIIYPRTYY